MDNEYIMSRYDAFTRAFAKKNDAIGKLNRTMRKPNHSETEIQNIKNEIAFYNYVINSTGMVVNK